MGGAPRALACLLLLAGAGSQPLCTLRNLTELLTPGSRELTAYLRHVYGPRAHTAAAHAWFARRLQCCAEILWRRGLPEAFDRACSWPSQPEGFGTVFTSQQLHWPPASLAIYRHRVAACAPGVGPEVPQAWVDELKARQERETALQPDRLAHLRVPAWVEVTHHFTADRREAQALYVYAAAGSGLWARVGRAAHLRSIADAPRLVGMHRDDFVRERMGAEGYDAVTLGLTCEWQSRGFLQEIALALRPSGRAATVPDRPDPLQDAGAFFGSACPALFRAGLPWCRRRCACCVEDGASGEYGRPAGSRCLPAEELLATPGPAAGPAGSDAPPAAKPRPLGRRRLQRAIHKRVMRAYWRRNMTMESPFLSCSSARA